VKGLQMTNTNIAKQGHAWQFKGRHEQHFYIQEKNYRFFKGQFQVTILKLIDS
jgi:hypothetical protein